MLPESWLSFTGWMYTWKKMHPFVFSEQKCLKYSFMCWCHWPEDAKIQRASYGSYLPRSDCQKLKWGKACIQWFCPGQGFLNLWECTTPFNYYYISYLYISSQKLKEVVCANDLVYFHLFKIWCLIISLVIPN